MLDMCLLKNCNILSCMAENICEVLSWAMCNTEFNFLLINSFISFSILKFGRMVDTTILSVLALEGGHCLFAPPLTV